MHELRIERVEEVDALILQDIGRLLPQVSSRATPLTEARLQRVVSNPATHLLMARRDGAVIGMALLMVCTTLAGQFGLIEEVPSIGRRDANMSRLAS